MRNAAGGVVLPNLSVIWVILFVLVLSFVLDRLLLRPVMGVIRAREEAIRSARELADRSAAEARSAAAEFERKTTAARAEIYQQMDDMRRTALGRRAEIVAQTRAEAEAAVADAARRLEDDAREARRRLEADADALGAAAADRILGRRVS
jgi:F-type H+-transporting ATPase subunit b